MKNKRNKLLIINYDFPPAGGAGIKRCLKFLKFLDHEKWEISVLTVKNGNHSMIDTSLLDEIDDEVKIFRSFTFESFFMNNRNKDITVKEAAGLKGDDNKSIKNIFGHFLKRTYNNHGHLFKVPDSRILWLPAAMFLSLKLVFKNKFDVIFATGPTFVNFILAAIIKTLSRKPLLIDFRDAWMADPMFQTDKKYIIKMHQIFEKSVINNADRVITTNPWVTDDFKKRYPSVDELKYDTIYNGYDHEDFEFDNNGTKVIDHDKLSIVYSGRLYGERSPKHFLKAIKLAVTEKPEIKNKIQVYFIGSCEQFLDGKYIENYIEENELQNIITLTGHISRTESLLYQKQSHILLLLIGIVPPEFELTYGISGKLFDYLLFNKPILTLANGGATRNFIVQNKIGNIYYHDEIEGIKNYLLLSYQKFLNNDLSSNNNIKNYQNFDFEKLTEKLNNHFISLLDKKG